MVDTTKEQALAQHMAPRIKRAISESALTYDAIGEAIGVSKAAVSKWTGAGKIKMANLLDLADVTKKPMAWFFPGFDDTPVSGAAIQDSVAFSATLEMAVSAGDIDALEEMLFDVLAAKRALSFK
jgi:transcriptional regulator with XRE-family HTH domain